MKKTKINIASDFILFGIVSDKNNYALLSQINTQLGFNFSQKENLKIIEKNNEKQFTVFEYFDECNKLRYRFLNNYSENGYLIPKLKIINFFIQIYNDVSDDFKQDLLAKLKNIKSILIVSEIEKKHYKKNKNLYY